MDQRTPRRALARAITVDTPEPGFFKLRLHAGGWHAVPCAIYHSDGLWSAEIDGELAGLPNPDPIHADGVLRIWHSRKEEISEAEYVFLTDTLKRWAREFYPDHPLLHPKDKVARTALRPIPAFSAPVAPDPLDEEPLPENRPAPPKPMDSEAVIEWLGYENEPLVKSIEVSVAQLTLDAAGSVDSETDLSRVGANLDIARGLLRQAKERHDTQKAPFRKARTTIDDWFRPYTSALTNAIAPVQSAMNAYGARVEAQRRAEAEAAAAEAQAKAAAAAQAAADALRNKPGSVQATVALDRAQQAATAADIATSIATGNVANLTRASHDYGGVISGQETWDFRVDDISKVPLAYLQINETLIRKTVREFTKESLAAARAGQSPIPGISLVRGVDMRNR